MGDICRQDDSYWCPLANDSCDNIPKPCVLLVSCHNASRALMQMGLMYKVIDGKFKLISERQRQSS